MNKETLSGKIECYGNTSYISTESVKEFIKDDWRITCHFLWDLLGNLSDKHKLNLSDFWIEKILIKLKDAKDKLAGEELING